MRNWLFAFIVGVFVASPVSAQVRLADVSGTVTDETGAVLPGVVITATHVATGQTRSVTTGDGGTYLLSALPVGTYTIRAELTSFKTVSFEDYTLGLGDSAVLDIVMQIATVEETITVTAQAPLIETKKSDLTGRINQVQMEDVPISGRGWLDLSVLAPGVKSTGGNPDQGSGGQPTSGVGDSRMSKVVLDGGSIQNLSTQAIDLDVSKDIIAEFEVLTNRFDAKMGRAGTTLVNAVTKSGTDSFDGSAYFYLRDDSLNAADFFTGQVETFQMKHYGGTFGGPLVPGKTHFFGSYERQVEPKTKSANTGIPIFDVAVDSTDRRNLWFIRIDHSFTSRHRLGVRYNHFDKLEPHVNLGGTRSVSNAHTYDFRTDRINIGLDSVVGQNFVNQLYVTYLDSLRLFNRFSGPPDREGFGLAPFDDNQHTFPSVRIGGVTNVGNEEPDFWLIRDDASYYLEKGGQHNMKFGGDFTRQYIFGVFASNSNGTFYYDEDPPNLASCCPGGDQSTWDKSQFPIPIRYSQYLGNFFYDAPNDIYGFYFQDDWTISDRLTLNLGVRYDLEIGSLASDFKPLIGEKHGLDADNIQPRFGFAWDATGEGKTILRGGGGLYTDQVYLNLTFNHRRTNRGDLVSVTTYNPDKDPNFAQDPLGGRTFEDFLAGAGPRSISVIPPSTEQPQVWAFSAGVAQTITPQLAMSADYVYQRSDMMLRSRDSNLFCCTPNGNALPIKSGFFPELGGQVEGVGRPDPRFDRINYYMTDGKARYHGLQVAVKKRWSRNYQFGITYLLSKNQDSKSTPNNVFDLDDEWATSALDQRHRFVANWVTRLPYDLTLSGIVYAASGQAIGVTTGGIDVNGDGSGSGDRPICGIDPRFEPGCSALGIPDGQRVPRNSLRSEGTFRVDLRLAKAFALARDIRVEPIFEIFNLFNRNNLAPNRYNNNLGSSRFGQPGRSAALPYLPRQIQLAVKMVF
jgi:hypothetical protein